MSDDKSAELRQAVTQFEPNVSNNVLTAHLCNARGEANTVTVSLEGLVGAKRTILIKAAVLAETLDELENHGMSSFASAIQDGVGDPSDNQPATVIYQEVVGAFSIDGLENAKRIVANTPDDVIEALRTKLITAQTLVDTVKDGLNIKSD